MQTAWPFCRYIPRNPFISCRRSLDVAETIRYTWNQLARSAGKWVKGLTAPERWRERERGRKKNAESLQFEKWLYHCVVHLPFFISFFFHYAHRSLFPFRVFAIRYISASVSIFISTFHPILPLCPLLLCLSARLSYVCISSLLCPFQLMEAHVRRLNAVRRYLRHFRGERPQLNRSNYICEHLLCVFRFSPASRRCCLRSSRNGQDCLPWILWSSDNPISLDLAVILSIPFNVLFSISCHRNIKNEKY